MKPDRLLSVILIVLIGLGLMACSDISKILGSKKTDTTINTSTKVNNIYKDDIQKVESPKAFGLLFNEPITLSMMTMSHPSWPYQEDWWIWNAIKEATNVTLNVSAYGSVEYQDKIQLTMASGKLPDLMYLSTEVVNRYALDGPFIDVMSNLDKAPNFKKWYISSEDAKNILKTYTSADGNVYVFPLVGSEVTTNKRGGWLGWIFWENII